MLEVIKVYVFKQKADLIENSADYVTTFIYAHSIEELDTLTNISIKDRRKRWHAYKLVHDPIHFLYIKYYYAKVKDGWIV